MIHKPRLVFSISTDTTKDGTWYQVLLNLKYRGRTEEIKNFPSYGLHNLINNLTECIRDIHHYDTNHHKSTTFSERFPRIKPQDLERKLIIKGNIKEKPREEIREIISANKEFLESKYPIKDYQEAAITRVYGT